jgi:malate dehydrogenase (oxaloacetate-decarboxylating)(NADP+)
VGAALRNGLKVLNKKISEVRLVCSGAGSAALACLDLLVGMGLRRDNIRIVDRNGVVYTGRRDGMDPYKQKYAVQTEARTLDDVITGADVFLGLSGPKVLTAAQVARMADPPLILALANPEPEILPEEALKGNPRAVIATGRSDYPNQVNNVLCFPFIFRGALDVGATVINEAMKIACVEAIADLALAETSDLVSLAYGGQKFRPRLPDTQALRSQADADRPGARGEGCHGQRRGDAPDRGFRRLSAEPAEFYLSHRHGDAPGIRACAQ